MVEKKWLLNYKQCECCHFKLTVVSFPIFMLYFVFYHFIRKLFNQKWSLLLRTVVCKNCTLNAFSVFFSGRLRWRNFEWSEIKLEMQKRINVKDPMMRTELIFFFFFFASSSSFWFLLNVSYLWRCISTAL